MLRSLRSIMESSIDHSNATSGILFWFYSVITLIGGFRKVLHRKSYSNLLGYVRCRPLQPVTMQDCGEEITRLLIQALFVIPFVFVQLMSSLTPCLHQTPVIIKDIEFGHRIWNSEFSSKTLNLGNFGGTTKCLNSNDQSSELTCQRRCS